MFFFRVQGILYTKIGIDELEKIFEQQFEQLKEYLIEIEKLSNKFSEVMKLQNISFILIFIAHATISDATKEIKEHNEQLEKGKVVPEDKQ